MKIVLGISNLSKEASFDKFSPATTNGSIVVYSGSTNIQKIIGNDGLVFTADSTAPGGVAWSPIPGGSGSSTQVTGSSNFFVTNLLKVSGTITNPIGHLILSSSAGSSIYVSGTFNVLDKATSFNNLVPTTTNGDLIVFSGSTNIRKPIGADGLVLTADSTAIGGVSWTVIVGGSGSSTQVTGSDDFFVTNLLKVSGTITNPIGHLILSSSVGSGIYVSGTLMLANFGNFDTRYITTASLPDQRYVLTSSYGPFTASMNSFSASVNPFTASINIFSQSINGFTASFTSSIQFIGDNRYVLTSSYGLFTASINSFTSSVNVFSSSHNIFSQSINGFTASFTGSVQFIGDNRYVLTSSYGPFTASINSFSASHNIFSQSINGFTASFTGSVQSIGDVRWVALSVYNPFSASINVFSQSINGFTSSFSSSVKFIGDGRYVLTSSTTDQLISGNIAMSNSFYFVSGSQAHVYSRNSNLILSSSAGSIIYISGVLKALDKTTTFDNLSPTTTNGDIIIFSGSTNIRKAIGANDTVLTADSTVIGGVKWATPTGGSGYSTIQDHGTPLTQRTTVNFAGAGVSSADSGGITVVTIAGAPGASWTETEIDFGTQPVYDAQFTIVDASVSTSSKIIIGESGKIATNRTDGDAQWDSIALAAQPGTGQFIVFAVANPGPVVGARKIHYSVA